MWKMWATHPRVKSCAAPHCDGALFGADDHQPTEDVGHKVGRLDVYAKTVRPDQVRVYHHILQDAGLQVSAGCLYLRMNFCTRWPINTSDT